MTISDEKLNEICLDALRTPMIKWDDVVNKLKEAGDKDCQGAADILSSVGVLSGMLAVYFGYRGAYGCGDSGHEKALKKAIDKRKTFRKAHGYSYP